MRTIPNQNGRILNSEQVRRRRCTALIIHAATGTLSIKDSDGLWHRHLYEIPQTLFLALSPEKRRRIVKAEYKLGRPLVEDSRLIVVLDRKPRKPRQSAKSWQRGFTFNNSQRRHQQLTN